MHKLINYAWGQSVCMPIIVKTVMWTKFQVSVPLIVEKLEHGNKKHTKNKNKQKNKQNKPPLLKQCQVASLERKREQQFSNRLCFCLSKKRLLTEEQTNGLADGSTDWRTNQWMDTPSYWVMAHDWKAKKELKNARYIFKSIFYHFLANLRGSKISFAYLRTFMAGLWRELVKNKKFWDFPIEH